MITTGEVKEHADCAEQEQQIVFAITKQQVLDNPNQHTCFAHCAGDYHGTLNQPDILLLNGLCKQFPFNGK